MDFFFQENGDITYVSRVEIGKLKIKESNTLGILLINIKPPTFRISLVSILSDINVPPFFSEPALNISSLLVQYQIWILYLKCHDAYICECLSS